MGVCLIAAKSGWIDLEFWFGLVMAIFALGVVIFVHELGHFVVAKMCGVKCLKFYVGFDPPLAFKFGKYTLRLPSAIWKRQWGETEYGIGIIPLGGYVRMLGQDDNPTHDDESPVVASGEDGSTPAVAPQLDPRNYQAKPVWQRMAIISAGVIMNVIFAFIFALAAVYAGVTYTPSIVGKPQPGDPAERQGLGPGDEFTGINGVKNPRFTDFQQQVVLSSKEKGIEAEVRPFGKNETITLTLKPENDYVSPKGLPRVGVRPEGSLTLDAAMPTFPDTTAHALPEGTGFKGGDTIVAVNDQPVSREIALEEILVRNVDKPLTFTVERKLPEEKQPAGSEKPVTEEVKITVPPNPWRELGLTMTMGTVHSVREKSPAATAKPSKPSQAEGGIKRGDKIVKIAGKPAGDPMTLPMRFRSLEGSEVTVTVERPTDDGPPQTIDFTTKLETPKYSAQSVAADSPMAYLALGVTYNVEAKVAEAPTGPAADKGIQQGDEVVSFKFVAQEKPQSDEQKEEAQMARRFEAVKLTPQQPAWPRLMTLVQSLSPQTGIELTLKGSEGEKKVVLHAVSSTEFYNPDRGLALGPMRKPLVVDSFGEALVFAGRETKSALLQVVMFLKKMAAGGVSPTSLAGPISIFRIAAHYAKEGLGSLLIFLTLLSANLAVLNFLPIPILDGGHMVFLAWEGIFGKPMSRRIADPLLYTGALLLLSLMLFTTVLDVQRLFN